MPRTVAGAGAFLRLHPPGTAMNAARRASAVTGTRNRAKPGHSASSQVASGMIGRIGMLAEVHLRSAVASHSPARIGVDLAKWFGYYHPLYGTELGNGGRLLAGRGTPGNSRRRTLQRERIRGPEPPRRRRRTDTEQRRAWSEAHVRVPNGTGRHRGDASPGRDVTGSVPRRRVGPPRRRAVQRRPPRAGRSLRSSTWPRSCANSARRSTRSTRSTRSARACQPRSWPGGPSTSSSRRTCPRSRCRPFARRCPSRCSSLSRKIQDEESQDQQDAQRRGERDHLEALRPDQDRGRQDRRDERLPHRLRLPGRGDRRRKSTTRW